AGVGVVAGEGKGGAGAVLDQGPAAIDRIIERLVRRLVEGDRAGVDGDLAEELHAAGALQREDIVAVQEGDGVALLRAAAAATDPRAAFVDDGYASADDAGAALTVAAVGR